MSLLALPGKGKVVHGLESVRMFVAMDIAL
jgi:hypothetical protein